MLRAHRVLLKFFINGRRIELVNDRHEEGTRKLYEIERTCTVQMDISGMTEKKAQGLLSGVEATMMSLRKLVNRWLIK